MDDPSTDMTSLQIARRLLGEALPRHWQLYIGSLICMIGVAGFTAALAYSTKLIVNEVFVAGSATAAYQVAALLVVVSIGKSGFEYANVVIATKFTRSVAAFYQKATFRAMVAKAVPYFAGKHAAKHMAEVMLFGRAAGLVVTTVLNKLSTDVLTLIGLVAVMIYTDPLMSISIAVLFPLIFGLVALLTRRIKAVAAEETELQGRIQAVGAEAFEGIKTVKSYGLEAKSKSKFAAAVNALENRMLGIAKMTSLTIPLMEFLGGLAIGLFILYASWQTGQGNRSAGDFTAFITAFLLAYQPAERVSQNWVLIQKSLVQVGQMYGLFASAQEDAQTGTASLEGRASALRFEGVSFRYNAEAVALHDVSFETKPGERIAVVGRSGAGKTTLIDLVQRFYAPTKGVISIGGQDIADVTPDALRDAIALISQDVFLFDGTIRNNMRDGKPDATDDEIAVAAERAMVTTFAKDMPDGLDSEIGPNGASLSGGQKQRVGIARAMVKNAKIYIYDEATSALDGANERAIMQATVDSAKDSTILFVTHRPSTLQWVDRVLLLDHGRVVAFETHETLMETNAIYRALFNLNTSDEERA
ncbi:MAG: ABC transporter ATP-binding protein [Pseudomonadota bacterium]